MSKSILIVDDEVNIRKFLKMSFSNKAVDVYTASSAEEALKIIDNHSIDLIITDKRLPNLSGIDLINEVKKNENSPYIVMMTAYSDVETAVEAMKSGAYDFLSKPFDIEELDKICSDVFALIDLKNERDLLKKQVQNITHFEMLGKSKVMEDTYSLISKVAPTNSTVLLQGETGTGKEVAARSIHQLSDRADKAFIAINCTAITESILESELFGNEKGAFTDAKQMKKGLFEIADQGTLFLDEIGDMPVSLQAKILRVLQEKTIRRLGGAKDIKVDVRIISATNKVLDKLVEEKLFREDLFFRINVFPITLPALRDRENDVVLLANAFIRHYSIEFGKSISPLNSEIQNFFLKYTWPGNIRELKNTIERILILLDHSEILEADLPMFLQKKEINTLKPNLSFKQGKAVVVDDFEQNYLTNLLIKHSGNVTKSAKEANIDRSSFLRLCKKTSYKSRIF
jgi:two-component system, NtrC family, response regulator AtoC